MPEPQLSNEEVANLTRAYLLRRTAQPYPRDLESRAMSAATSEVPHRSVSWMIVSALVTIVAVGAIGVAFALGHGAAPAPSRPAPVPTQVTPICSSASVRVSLTPPGTASTTYAGGVLRYATDGVLFTNSSSSDCYIARPTLMQVSIPSEILTIDNLAKIPPRTHLAPGASVTLEFGDLVMCATYQPTPTATGVTLQVPNLGTLSLTGLHLDLTCGAPIVLAMQPSPTTPPSASPSISTATSAPLCLASQVQISYLMGASGAAAGNTSIVLGLRNSGARPCELRGWPVVEFVAGNGDPLPTRETQTTSDFAMNAGLQTVILQTGTASLGTSQPIGSVPLGSPEDDGYGFIGIGSNDILSPCETAASIRVALPGVKTPIVVTLRVPMAFPTGQVVCSGGRIQVLPILR
jgi:hypothetical protein